MSVNENILYFSSDRENSPLTQLRLKIPLQYAGFNTEQGGYTNNDQKTEKLNLGSIQYLVIQRDFTKQIDLFFNILQEKRKQNIPLIYEIDDLLFELPDYHPIMQKGCYAFNFTPMLKAVCNADLVTVSTQPIAEYLKPFNQNIKVLPNYLIDEYWQLHSIKITKKNPNIFVIGFLGGSTHSEDLHLILDPLLQINDQYPGKIHFEFWGSQPPKELKIQASIEVNPIIQDYENYAKAIQSRQYDILIAPLVDNKFNQAKSNLKFLEYSALGVPGVFSNVKPFKDIVKNGENGYLASSSEEWFYYLKLLIESPEKRQEIAQNAQNTVKNNFMLSQHSNEWLNAYQSIKLRAEKSGNGSRNVTNEQRERILKHIFKVQKEQSERITECYQPGNSKIKAVLSKLISLISQ